MGALLLLVLSLCTHAADLAGVHVADTATVGGKSLVLNGLGLREKYYIDIYVGALYLPAKTKVASSAITEDVPKRISMSFIYSSVTKDQLAESFHEGLAYQGSKVAAVSARVDQLCGMMVDLKSGDVVAFDYAPGTGTAVIVNGSVKGTIAGKDFMESLWTIYLGPNPPTEKLKTGMLGAS